MAIKKNETKINKSLIKTSSKKVGRKAFKDSNLKAEKRNTFLLNTYQQEKMESRMEELGIRSKTDYIVFLLKSDIIDL